MLKLLSEAVDHMTIAIKGDLHLARQVVIGMDCWSKKSLTAAFLAISASFYHPLHRRPVHILLNLHQLSHPHTGEVLAEKLMQTLECWEIDKSKVMMVVTDNGSNMIKALRVANLPIDKPTDGETDIADDDDDYYVDEDDDPSNEEEVEDDDHADDFDHLVNLHRFPCIAHTLQLVIKELSKNQSVCNLIAKAKDLVSSIKMSSVAQEKLVSLCGKVVVKDCATRWNSIALMLERLLSLRTEVEAVLKEMKRDSLSNTEWARLNDILNTLVPFKEQTDNLQSDTMALSYVIPSLLELSLHLKSETLPKTISNQLLKSLQRRFAIFLDPDCPEFDPRPVSATLLDPTVSACMMRDDTVALLAAARTFIKSTVSKCSSLHI
jgi:hypothetical protein